MLKQLRRARGRLLRNELLSAGANSICAALAGFIVLLLAGAQTLNWRWLLLPPIVAALFGVWRARKRLPQAYATAQLLDHRLDLADTLSSAFYFTQSNAGPPGPVARRLLEKADHLSESLDIRKASPYTMPRAAYPMLALFLIASSLFALRHAIGGKLDWNAPMARLLQWNPFAPDRALAQNLSRRDPNVEPAQSETADSAETGDASRDRAADRPGKNGQDSASGKPGKPSSSDTRRESAAGQQKREAENAEAAEQDGTREQAETANAAEQTNREPGRPKPGEHGSQAGAQQGGSDSPSLMDRFKDAVQSLFARSREQGGEESRQAGAGGNSQSSNSQMNAKQRANAEKQPGGQGSAQRGEANRSVDSGDASQSGRGSSNSEADGEKRAGNGIGSEDGDKAIKQAEQLAAMGKISEIFGKRAANLTGQATVEVQSATQQLRTPYEQRSGTHSDAGAEIGRDEVPPALQAYVKEYFAQLRKQRAK